MGFLKDAFYFVFNLLWGDIIKIPMPDGKELGISVLVIILLLAGIYFTIRSRFLSVRLLPEMMRLTTEKKPSDKKGISGLQALIVSTATRVGMGNLVGVVAAISLGGAGAVFWMWITAILGSATAFAEGTLAQLHRNSDPLYSGYRGGPAYYIHDFFESRKNTKKRFVIISVLFAISGLICWCGISQVIGNSVSESMKNAFSVPPVATAVALSVISAIIVLRKNATVKVLDVVVPIMAGGFFLITLFIIFKNITLLSEVFARIFKEAFGIKQIAGGSFGAVIMNGVKRGLFSNEAGSGSAPCAAAAANSDHPAKQGLLQAYGVFIDTIIICSCTAMIILLVPENVTEGLSGMQLLQASMEYHLGYFGVVFIAVTVLLFSFSTFIGVLFYARSNVSYLFGDRWSAQTLYKILALIMLFMGCLAKYTFVWDLGDFGIALMTIFNMIVLIPMSSEAFKSLKDYEQQIKIRKKQK